jgi:hypothetical protein
VGFLAQQDGEFFRNVKGTFDVVPFPIVKVGICATAAPISSMTRAFPRLGGLLRCNQKQNLNLERTRGFLA